MQSRPGGVFLPVSRLYWPKGWPQAGLNSFAYRLAHSRPPRQLLIFGAALPVQAASFSFGFGFGDGVFGHRHRLTCLVDLSDSQIRRAVAAQGYSNIYLNVANGHRIQVRATQGDWVYLLRVSTCTGAILDTQKLRKA